MKKEPDRIIRNTGRSNISFVDNRSRSYGSTCNLIQRAISYKENKLPPGYDWLCDTVEKFITNQKETELFKDDYADLEIIYYSSNENTRGYTEAVYDLDKYTIRLHLNVLKNPKNELLTTLTHEWSAHITSIYSILGIYTVKHRIFYSEPTDIEKKEHIIYANKKNEAFFTYLGNNEKISAANKKLEIDKKAYISTSEQQPNIRLGIISKLLDIPGISIYNTKEGVIEADDKIITLDDIKNKVENNMYNTDDEFWCDVETFFKQRLMSFRDIPIHISLIKYLYDAASKIYKQPASWFEEIEKLREELLSLIKN